MEFTFKGIVKILLQATTANVTEIVLHQNSLDISQYKINDVTFNYDPNTYEKETDKWTIPLDAELPQDTTTNLEIHYIGYLKDDMNGFYRSYYNEGGKRVWMASTQFQQTEVV